MPKTEDLTRLNRHSLFSSLASLGVLLFGLIGFILYFVPSLAGVDLENSRIYEGKIIWLVMGIILSSAGIVFFYISNRWPGQLKKTVLHTLPERMMMGLEVEEDSDNTTYYVILSKQSVETGKTLTWRAQIWIHPPQIREDIGRQFECDVFLNPASGLPAAVEYSKGVLWVRAGAGAVERFVDR